MDPQAPGPKPTLPTNQLGQLSGLRLPRGTTREKQWVKPLSSLPLPVDRIDMTKSSVHVITLPPPPRKPWYKRLMAFLLRLFSRRPLPARPRRR